MNKEKYVVVIKPTIARKLLKMNKGYQIVDIKPQKQINGETDFTRCVFVFKYADGINEDINALISELKEIRNL